MVDLYPPLGATVLAENGSVIPASGISTTATKYYTDLLRAGGLLTYDPRAVAVGDPTQIPDWTGNLTASYSTTSEMALVVGGYHGAVATATGCNSPQDGGGGTFYWDSNDTTTVANGGTVLGALIGRWKRSYSGGVNIAWFGAVAGDGVSSGQRTTNTAALVSAAAVAAATQGYVLIPRGTYEVNSGCSFDSTVGCGLVGDSGGVAGSKLKFLATGSGNLITARSSGGFFMRDLDLLVVPPSGSFTGKLVNLDGSLGSDTAYATLSHCQMAISGNTGTLVSAVKAFNVKLGTVVLSACDVGFLAKNSSSDYCNVVSFTNCSNPVNTVTTAVVKNPGEGWAFSGCSFEALVSGAAGAILATEVAIGTSVNGCWFGDANNGGSWLKGAFDGLSVTGSQFTAISTPSVVGIEIDPGSIGASITGNSFSGLLTAIKFNTAMVSATVRNNVYTSVTNLVIGAPTTGDIQVPTSNGGLFAGNSQRDYSLLRARIEASSPQNLPSGTPTKMAYDLTTYDPNGNVSAYQYTAPVTGYYQVNGYADLNGFTAGNFLVSYIYVNGSPYTTGLVVYASNAECGTTISDVVYATAGQPIALYVNHNHGSDVALLRGYLSVHYLSS